MALRLDYISFLLKITYPAVAQPGRAFGCSCWQIIANRTSAYQAYIQQ